jgi:Skp family chaperone for outer membrane proteins
MTSVVFQSASAVVRRLLSPAGKDSVMKKLVVIIAALALAGGGFGRMRFATAQSPAPPSSERATAAVQSTRDAVVDLPRAITELHGFKEDHSAIKAKLKKFQEEQEAKLKAGEDKAKIESLRAEAVKQAQLAEAKLHHDAFERIRAAITEHAKEHGIRVVRRSNTIVRPDDNVDVNDRKAVMIRFNRPFIYLDEPSANNDITDAILQRLNGSSDRR